jgi:membrane-associated protease RseP (regulator of RpoE activity)
MFREFVTRWLGVAALLLVGSIAPLHAQEGAARCAADEMLVGVVYTSLQCNNCSLEIVRATRERRWSFGAEPTITGVRDEGAAGAKLRAGDVVVAIDGYLITTQEGGKRFAEVRPNEPITLRVRRDGREREVRVVPDARCESLGSPVAPAAPAAPAAVAGAPAPAAPVAQPAMIARPRPAAAAAVPTALKPTLALPRGSLGFSIRCDDCSVQILKTRAEPIWSFSSDPIVERVERGSQAAQAGLRAGDVLTHIDGRALTSAEGGRAFGAVQPGDTVALGFVRNSRPQRAVMVAEARQWTRAAPASAPMVAGAETTRFSGTVGDAHVVVTGGPITVTRTDDEVVIQSRDITVRITKGPEREDRK